MNKVFKIIGLVLVVAASIAAYFTDIAVANYIELAVGALGLALTIKGVWGKSEKKTWKEVFTIILFCIGAFLLGFAGVSESVVTQIITAIAGVVSLVIGVIVSFVKNKSETTTETN